MPSFGWRNTGGDGRPGTRPISSPTTCTCAETAVATMRSFQGNHYGLQDGVRGGRKARRKQRGQGARNHRRSCPARCLQLAVGAGEGTYGEKLRRNGATIKGSFRLDGSPTHLLRLPSAGRTTRHGAPRTSKTKAIAATWDRAPPAPATWRHRVEDRRRGRRWQTERRRSAV